MTRPTNTASVRRTRRTDDTRTSVATAIETPTVDATPPGDPTRIPPDGTEVGTYPPFPVRRRVRGKQVVPGVPDGLSVVEVSELLGVSAAAVRRLKARGELQGGGRPLRIFPASVEAYKARGARVDARAGREVRGEAHRALDLLAAARVRRGGLSADQERVVGVLAQVSGRRPRDPESLADPAADE